MNIEFLREKIFIQISLDIFYMYTHKHEEKYKKVWKCCSYKTMSQWIVIHVKKIFKNDSITCNIHREYNYQDLIFNKFIHEFTVGRIMRHEFQKKNVKHNEE